MISDAKANIMKLAALRILSHLLRIVLKCHGVKIGKEVWLHGLPELLLAKGSTVVIEDSVTLCSWSRLNPLAPARRLSIVTKTPHARVIIKKGAGVSNSVISCHEKITIGENTLIGAECLIIDSDFHGIPLGKGLPMRVAPVEIGTDVFVGARSIILKGVRIGNGSVIGAGSVVTASIPNNCLAAGNPARIIRSFDTGSD